jgi:hypothetical protein
MLQGLFGEVLAWAQTFAGAELASRLEQAQVLILGQVAAGGGRASDELLLAWIEVLQDVYRTAAPALTPTPGTGCGNKRRKTSRGKGGGKTAAEAAVAAAGAAGKELEARLVAIDEELGALGEELKPEYDAWLQWVGQKAKTSKRGYRTQWVEETGKVVKADGTPEQQARLAVLNARWKAEAAKVYEWADNDAWITQYYYKEVWPYYARMS